MSTRSGRVYKVREIVKEMANLEGANQVPVTELLTRLLLIFNYSKAGGGALRACPYKAG